MDNTTRDESARSIDHETPSSITAQIIVGVVFAVILCFLLKVAIKYTP
jgi:hypothetical protein